MRPLLVGAILGFLGVALGAFGAHGLAPLLTANDTLETWRTATQYLQIHAVALVAVAALPRPPSAWVVRAFVLGIALFSGSLFVLAVTGARWLGAITPLGGVALLIGWARLAWDARAT